MTSKTRADLALLWNAFIWGTTFVLVKDALDDIAPFLYTAIRFAMAATLFYILFHRRMQPFTGASLRAGIITGIWLAIGYGTQTLGLVYTSASRSAFITGFSVVLVPLMAPLFTGRSPNRAAFVGPVAALAGLYFLTAGGPQLPINQGDAWTFVCAAAYAAHLLCVERYTRQFDYIGLTFLQLAVACVVNVIPAAVLEPWSIVWSGSVISAFAVTVALGTVLAFYILNRVQRNTTAVHAAVIFTMEPVFAGLLAITVYGEQWGLLGYGGALLIIAGMIYSMIRYQP
jgi:drug/metabolite transporter (DMT)-like permease